MLCGFRKWLIVCFLLIYPSSHCVLWLLTLLDAPSWKTWDFFSFLTVICFLLCYLPTAIHLNQKKNDVWLGTKPLPVTWSSTYRHNFIIISLFWGFSGSYYHGSHRLFLVYYKVLSCLCFRFFFCFCFLHFMFSSSLTSWICRTG